MGAPGHVITRETTTTDFDPQIFSATRSSERTFSPNDSRAHDRHKSSTEQRIQSHEHACRVDKYSMRVSTKLDALECIPCRRRLFSKSARRLVFRGKTSRAGHKKPRTFNRAGFSKKNAERGIQRRVREKQRERYFFFLTAFLAAFLAGFFLAMPKHQKVFVRLHENFSVRVIFFSRACARNFLRDDQRPESCASSCR